MIVTGAIVVLWLAVIYLLALGIGSLVARERAHRFLASFAQSPRANWTESLLRLLVGMAFVAAAPALDPPIVARTIGIFLAITAVMLTVFPTLHRRFAAPAVASVAPFLPLLGIASIALAGLLAGYIA